MKLLDLFTLLLFINRLRLPESCWFTARWDFNFFRSIVREREKSLSPILTNSLGDDPLKLLKIETKWIASNKLVFPHPLGPLRTTVLEVNSNVLFE